MKSGYVSHRKANHNRRRLLQALGFACLAASALSAHAQTAYTWDGGTGNWSNGSLWSLGTSPNDPTADVYVDGGKTTVNSVVDVDGGFTIGRLTVDQGDTVNINDNQQLTVQAGSFAGSGSIIDNGTINVASGGGDSTILAFTNGAASLSGTGTLNLMNNAYVYTSSGNLLTIGAGFTITGMGQLGNGTTTFLNNGTVNANSSGNVLDLRPSGPGSANASFSNQGAGLAEASGGGTLYLDGYNGGTFSGGTFQALAGSTINILNGTTVSGATLSTTGTGVINLFGSSVLSNVTSTGTINVPDNDVGVLAGTFTNTGTLTIASGGGDTTYLELSGPVTLAGTGTINMVNSAYLFSQNSGDLLTIGAGVTIEGMGQLGNGTTTFLNNGTVNANSSGNVLDLRPSGPGSANASFINQGAGLAEATGGGTLYLDGYNGGTFSGGTFQALAGSTVNVLNGAIVSGATLSTTGSGVINLFGSATLSNVTSTGTINVPDNDVGVLAGTFTNTGTLTIASGGGDTTYLELSGPVTLAGTGTINMVNSAYLFSQNSGDLLTIGAGVTIEGMGQLGNGTTTFLNNGTVNANSSGNVLDLRPSGPGSANASFSNQGAGLAEASGGGTLYLDGYNGGTFSGGTFQALAGSTINILNGTTVSGATLSTTGTGVINLFGSSVLSNVTSTGTINVPDNDVGVLAGTFTNTGTLTIASGGGDTTYLELSGPVTLAGTGTINMVNSAYLFSQSSGDLLTIGAGVTIAGMGQLGNGTTTFLNNGTVNANSSGNVLDLRPSGPGSANASFSNQGAGLAEASGGGTLYLDGYNGGTFSGGTFQALAGSTINILNGTTVSGATLSTTGTGVINLFGSSVLSNVTSTGTINVPDNDVGVLAGTFTNTGTLTIASGGGDTTYLELSGPVTLAGTGTINMVNSAYLFSQSSGDLLTIGAGVTIAGMGQLGNGTTTFLNNGTVNANSSGNVLDLRPGGGTGLFTNGTTGLAEATGGGTLHLDGNNGGTFTNNGTFAVVSGSTGGSSELTVDAGTLTNFSGTTLTGGTYNVLATDPSTTSTLSLGGGTITTNAASVTLSGANAVFNEIGGITSNQGSFAVANGRNFTTVGALANSGTVVAAGGSTLTVTGAFTQSATGTITGNGAYTAPGGFTIAGAVNPGGTVSATTGAFTGGPGTTTFNSGTTPATETTFTTDALFTFELGAATGTNDHLTVNGLLNLNGTLDVTALAGFGTGTYDLIDYPVADSAYLLTHDTLALGSLPAGYTYLLLDTVPGQVDLTVIQNVVPEPRTWAFVLGGATLLVAVQRRRGNARRGVHQ